MSKQMKVRLNKRALIARINRVLARDGYKTSRYAALRAARGEKAQRDLGDYFIVDGRGTTQYVLDSHIDPEVLARKLGVLQAFEELDNEVRD